MSGFEMMRLASERLKLGRIAAIEAAMNEGLVLGGAMEHPDVDILVISLTV